jgi:DNA-binding beta-propeller fold protein YncE
MLGVLLVAAASIATEPPPVYLSKWGVEGGGAGQFDAPLGVAIDAAGNVYVAEEKNDRIQKFDHDGAFQLMWGWGVDDGSNEFQICTARCRKGIPGPGTGQFQDPADVAVDSSGNVYVADRNNSRIQKFNSSGGYLLQWGSYGTVDGRFRDPRGLAVDYSGHVYVVEFLGDRVQKFDSNGAYVTKWGWNGSGDGEFSGPNGVAVDDAGVVYVTEYVNSRVQRFEGDGSFLGKWGAHGSGDGEFIGPEDVAVDASGHVYVVDGTNRRVQMFDRKGEFLAKWGSYCDVNMSGVDGCDGLFWGPAGIALDAAGLVYVTEESNDRVQKFGGPWLDSFIALGDSLKRSPCSTTS